MVAWWGLGQPATHAFVWNHVRMSACSHVLALYSNRHHPPEVSMTEGMKRTLLRSFCLVVDASPPKGYAFFQRRHTPALLAKRSATLCKIVWMACGQLLSNLTPSEEKAFNNDQKCSALNTISSTIDQHRVQVNGTYGAGW